MNIKDINTSIEELRCSAEYKAYLSARENVLMMMAEWSSKADMPSNYWQEELSGYEYLFDASPLIINKLREHCYHLTGLRSYEYRVHHAGKISRFESKLKSLREQDRNGLLVPESPMLGGFGHIIDNVLINLDTLKFYESMIALDKADILKKFRDSKTRKTVMEIGAGWGGFAYQFKKLFTNSCYIIMDLPQTLLFSIVYLKTLFPSSSFLIYGDKPASELFNDYEKYDFIFLPHYFWEHTYVNKPDLAINLVSFQEMTSIQVENYIRRLSDVGCSHIYSHNRDCSPYNKQLTSVSKLIEKYYRIQEYKVLDLQYNYFTASSVPKNQDPMHKYRHIVGTL